MVEYISVVTAVSLLALTVGGQLSGRTASLPSTSAAALKLVASGARSQKVPVAGARTAYARAPFGKPVLKYFYATGWIGGTKDRTSCLLTVLGQDGAQGEATAEIRKNRKIMRQLRKRSVTAPQASSALVQGVVSACS